MPDTCSDAECERPAVCKGLCWTHYKRQKRGARITGEIRAYGTTGNTKMLEAIYAMTEQPSVTREAARRILERIRVAVIRSTKRRH